MKKTLRYLAFGLGITSLCAGWLYLVKKFVFWVLSFEFDTLKIFTFIAFVITFALICWYYDMLMDVK
jgi:hypothetical protein